MKSDDLSGESSGSYRLTPQQENFLHELQFVIKRGVGEAIWQVIWIALFVVLCYLVAQRLFT